jgi:hypothetical protein
LLSRLLLPTSTPVHAGAADELARSELS